MPDASSPLPSVGFVSLGCAKNLVDSQVMADRLLADQLQLAPTPESADVVIVNTCAFIEDARQESLEMIDSVCQLKKAGRCRAVLVAGCLPQRYRKDLQTRLPDVDGFIGLDELDEIGSVVRQLLTTRAPYVKISTESRRLYEPGASGVVFTGGPYAYLKIAEGCNHRCAFCAIPAIRGRHRSRPMDSILREAANLLEKGFRELNLISQDTTYYGRDLPKSESLASLLRALGKIGGHFWIRVLYGYPAHVDDVLLQAMAETPQVLPYLDIPVQHSHPEILRRMDRHDTVERVALLARRIREALPDAVVRTTCLVGFPGEKDEHFRHLLDFIQATEFDHLGVFAYSPEAGTSAEKLEAPPPEEVRAERRDRLMQVQQTISRKRNGLQVGMKTRALIERPVPDEDQPVFLARTPRQAPEVDGDTFVIDLPGDTRPGSFVYCEITAATEYDLVAVPTSQT